MDPRAICITAADSLRQLSAGNVDAETVAVAAGVSVHYANAVLADESTSIARHRSAAIRRGPLRSGSAVFFASSFYITLAG